MRLTLQLFTAITCVSVSTEVPINDSYLGILIIKIDRSYTKQANNTPQTCICPAMAVRVIKDYQALTGNSP